MEGRVGGKGDASKRIDRIRRWEEYARKRIDRMERRGGGSVKSNRLKKHF